MSIDQSRSTEVDPAEEVEIALLGGKVLLLH